MQTFDDKIDAAVHAALMAMGLSVENAPFLADLLNEWLTVEASYYISDDNDE